MYIDYYSEDPDYFGMNDPQPKNNSYYYDGRGNVYQGGYGKIVSGQDPCYYANMRNRERAQNPFMNPNASRRYMDEAAPQIPQYQQEPNYFNMPAAYTGYGTPDPQYFGYSQEKPNASRRYGITPYRPESYQVYQPKQLPVQPPLRNDEGGLNTSLFNQQRGYSNPINQNFPQQFPQRQLLKVSCPQQSGGFGPNRWNTPRMPSDPNIDWGSLKHIDNVNATGYVDTYGQYGQQRLIPVPPRQDESWYDIARRNFGK